MTRDRLFSRCRASRTVLSALTVFLLGGLGVAPTRLHAARAQENVGTPKEIQALLTELDDIDTMHALAPLKLTPAQAGQLATAITTARTEYDRKVNALGSAPLIKMADEIHATRKKAIAGEAIPKAFDDRVKAVEKDFVAKRDELNKQNILSLGAGTKAILDATQVATAAKLEKSVMEKQGKSDPSTPEALLYNAYVVDVFINNVRTVPLLQEMKTAAK